MYLSQSKLRLIIILVLFISSSSALQAQRKPKKTKLATNAITEDEDLQNLKLDYSLLTSDSIPDIELEMSEEELSQAEAEEEPRKTKSKKGNKKKKKKIYFGIKTRKGFARRVSGNTYTIEVFRMIEPEQVMRDPYQKEIYYYDVKARKIRNKNYHDLMAIIKKGKPIYLLHGSYEMYRNKTIRAEGFYYKGCKQGKWKEYNSKGVLMEKMKYDLGIPKDSKITYYDAAKTKIEEIIPVVHGRMQGDYYYFYENGVTAMHGKYENNQKVGMWREWYETRQRMKDTLYPIRWWEETEPQLLREWDKKGYLTYDIDRGGDLTKDGKRDD